MTPLPELSQLSHAEKDALILALHAQLTLAQQTIAALEARIAVLETRLDELTRPPKTPNNSSMPPSRGQKGNRRCGDFTLQRQLWPVMLRPIGSIY